MREGYRGSTEPIPAMKTVRPTSINDKGEIVTDGGLIVGKVIHADTRSVETIDAIIDGLRDEIHTLKLQRKWQKEAIQRVRALIEDWKNDDEHAGCAYALLAALVHDDSEKADG